MNRDLLWTVLIVLTLFLVLSLCLFLLGNFFFDFALKRSAKHGLKSPGPNPTAEGAAAFSGGFGTEEECAWFHSSKKDRWVSSEDGLKLHALVVEQESPCHRWAVVHHGFTGFSAEMARFAKGFYDLRCNVLLPDARAHGQSEGDVRGMGWLDREDILCWVDEIVRMDPEADIVLYGISMGGAIVMMASGEPALSGHVRGIIEDCGYTSVWDEFSVQLKNLFHLPAFPLLYVASLVTKLRGGYWLGEADCLKQVKKCRLPMLMIHGEADKFVPYSMLDEIYQAAPCEKEKLSVPGADHGKASAEQPARYWDAVARFCGKYLDGGTDRQEQEPRAAGTL